MSLTSASDGDLASAGDLASPAGRRTVDVDLASLRTAGAVMLGAGLVWPLRPHGFGIPCGFRAITGIPCPLCGMTTSVTATMHLRLGDALAANPAGIVAVAVAIVLLLLIRRTPPLVAVPRWVVPAGLALLWSCQLLRLLFT